MVGSFPHVGLLLLSSSHQNKRFMKLLFYKTLLFKERHIQQLSYVVFPPAKRATCSYKHITTRKGAETVMRYEAFAVLGAGCRELSSMQFTLKHPASFACQILSHLPRGDKTKCVSQ